MDDITYNYALSGGRLTNNRLQHATDAVAASSNPDDYEVGLPTAGNNFNYDRNGNLVYDKSEGIDKITWNVYGKVTKVDRTAGHAKPDLEFYYDAAGRRVMKIVKPNGGSGAKTTWKYVVFSYDAGGQLMAEYEIAQKGGTYRLTNTGNYLYGSSRLGKTREKIPVGPVTGYTEVQQCTACATASLVAGNAATQNIYSRTAGNKQYEFSNHLGNVLVTVSDRHLQTDDGVYAYSAGTLTKSSDTPDGRLDYYLPDVLTATDYYPGGMPMPGRTQQGAACSTQTTVNTVTLRSDAFASGTASYTSVNGATLSNSSGALLVTKLSSAIGLWAARTPAHTLSTGIYYELSYLLTPGTCSAGRETMGWRVVNASGTEVASGSSSGGSVYGTFTVPANGTYYIEFYRNTSTTGTCSFTVDNVLLTYTTYVHTTVCGTPSAADQYLWGHNGQYKDDEIYGPGNTYTAEYWEYDSRLLRRWNTDPVKYAWQSTYACFNNNPIYFIDPLGLEGTNDSGGKSIDNTNNDNNGGGPKGKTGKTNMLKTVKIRDKSLKQKMAEVGVQIVTTLIKIDTFIKMGSQEEVAGAKKIGTFFMGLGNAWGSNNIMGAGRKNPNEFGPDASWAHAGQKTGDAIAMYQGVFQMEVAASGEMLGGMLDATGLGAIVGVPLGAASLTLAVDGSFVLTTAAHNFAKTGEVNSNAHDEISSDGNNVSQPTNPQTPTPSKTLWKGKGKERVDVENPNPKQRPGQVHYQDNDGNKYIYDPSTNSFPGAPKKVNQLLNDSRFKAGIEKGLKYLGY